MVTVYHLICEGPCNPDIASLDAAIARETGASTAVALSSGTIAWAREMQYTRHLTSNEKDHVFCTVCGTQRRYGMSVAYTPYYLKETHGDAHESSPEETS